MKLTKRTDWKIVIGTSLQGYMDMTYEELVLHFGEPSFFNPGTDEKTQAEWILDYDGTIITIYDYKEYGVDVRAVTDWHIGGKSSKVLDILNEEGFDVRKDY